jgi:hypothetical protein
MFFYCKSDLFKVCHIPGRETVDFPSASSNAEGGEGPLWTVVPSKKTKKKKQEEEGEEKK